MKIEYNLIKIQEIARNLIVNNNLDSKSLNLITQKYDEISPGKMLRSKLVLAVLGDRINFDALRLCAIIELIQCASLLHDDVIDESELRRGKSSINSKFGNKNAIMLGDILYSNAFFELCSMDVKIAKSIAKSVVKLSLGEMQDTELTNEFNLNLDSYIDMIKNKSASLIGASSYCASVILDNSEQVNNSFYQYGLNLGIAFQIIDDILDITQDIKALGKPSLNDFKQGKTTLPYIYLYEELDSQEKLWLISCFKRDLDEKDTLKLKNLLNQNALSRAKNKALDYGQKALNLAKELNNSNLEIIINNMIDRSF